jgi:hypothetical protein
MRTGFHDNKLFLELRELLLASSGQIQFRAAGFSAVGAPHG